MFPRRIIGLASLPLTFGLATDTYAQRRPDPPPPVVYDAPLPERYRVAEEEVLARLHDRPVPPVVEPVRHETTVIVRHDDPVDREYARRRCDPPPPPRVVYVEPAPVVVHCPPPRPAPVYVCPPPRPVYDCRPRYWDTPRYWDRPRCDSGFSFSISLGDDHHYTRYRYRDRDDDYRPRRRHCR